MVERMVRIHEVRGSIPLISTKARKSEPLSNWSWVRIFVYLEETEDW